jgi:hypothetical protein
MSYNRTSNLFDIALSVRAECKLAELVMIVMLQVKHELHESCLYKTCDCAVSQ